MVDDFNGQLHPTMTKGLVALFNSSTNRHNSQLIFATHDYGLLNAKKICRQQNPRCPDSVCKEKTIGASEHFSLS